MKHDVGQIPELDSLKIYTKKMVWVLVMVCRRNIKQM